MNARIIPARAGFTGGCVLGDVEWEDHPRSRGVYSHPENMESDP